MWLITGANGQLGRCMQTVLADASVPYVAYGSADLDITDRQQIETVFASINPSVVINAAAYTAVDKAESERERALAVNADGPELLSGMCAEASARFIHISTDYVFDGRASQAYDESSPVDPQSVYGSTKLQGEQRVTQNPDATVIRTAWVFSEHGGNFLKTMLRLAREKESLGVVADQIGCPTYAGDIAQAILQLVQKQLAGEASAGIYHYAGDVAVSWWSFASYIHQQGLLAGKLERLPQLKMLATHEYPTPATRPANSVLLCEKMLGLGIEPSDWQSAVKKVIALLD